MTASGYTLFETPIGRCGIAWTAVGIAGVQLPEAHDTLTDARIRERCREAPSGTPPPDVQRAIEGILALLRREESDLGAIALDMDGVPQFHRRVYEAARAIPPGSTLSYGDVAARIGTPGSARAVGQALGRNPFPLIVPCHRVLAAGGKVGGFSANGGIATKLRLLSIESGGADGQLALFDGDAGPRFDAEAAVNHLRGADATLAKLIDAVGPFEMAFKRTPSLFGALAEAIVYQQLHGKAAATIFARLCASFPRAHDGPSAEQILRASDGKLRAAGLSGAKTASLRDLARRARAGEIPTIAEAHGMSDDALVERLTAVRGIGRWTVEMLLMFRLGRPDVLPVDDYGIRQGFAVAFGRREMPSRDDVAKRGARWKPYRTVASWYLWRAAERAKS